MSPLSFSPSLPELVILVVLEMQMLEMQEVMLQCDPATFTSKSWPDMMWSSRFFVWKGER